METYSLHVSQDDSNQRLDHFLVKNLPDMPSRTFIKKIIDAQTVSVNDRVVKAHHKVAAGDVVAVTIPDVSPQDIEPEDIPLDIFYEDADMIVVNKPSGMTVHPAAGCYTGTLVNALLHYTQQLSDVNESSRPGIVHRLDRETSGLLVVAKNNVVHVRLARQFEKHRVRKCYHALVEGLVEFDEGIIDASISRHPFHREKKAVAFHDDAKEAKTRYRVVKRAHNKTLIALMPQTGRTHQLRVHMAHIGHPILGDDKYGRKSSFSRLALHAHSIGFVHPVTKHPIEFSLPAPAEFFQAL